MTDTPHGPRDEADLLKTFVLQHVASALLIALIFLCVAWELWLAPIRPGGSWLVLKALPLLAPLMGILKGRRYTYQWAPMLVLAYTGAYAVGSALSFGVLSRRLGTVQAGTWAGFLGRLVVCAGAAVQPVIAARACEDVV